MSLVVEELVRIRVKEALQRGLYAQCVNRALTEGSEGEELPDRAPRIDLAASVVILALLLLALVAVSAAGSAVPN